MYLSLDQFVVVPYLGTYRVLIMQIWVTLGNEQNLRPSPRSRIIDKWTKQVINKSVKYSLAGTAELGAWLVP